MQGLEHPWDHGHGDHGDHGDHHSGPYKFERTEIGERPTLVGAEEDDE